MAGKIKTKKVSKSKVSTEKSRSLKKTVKKYSYAIGRRKTSVASVRLFKGKGESLINGKKIDKIYNSLKDKKVLNQPFKTTKTKGDYYFTAKTKGGGKSGQLDALKLALSRALIKDDESFRAPLKKAKFLRVDARVKERKKPGFKKARKKEQFSKR